LARVNFPVRVKRGGFPNLTKQGIKIVAFPGEFKPGPGSRGGNFWGEKGILGWAIPRGPGILGGPRGFGEPGEQGGELDFPWGGPQGELAGLTGNPRKKTRGEGGHFKPGLAGVGRGGGQGCWKKRLIKFSLNTLKTSFWGWKGLKWELIFLIGTGWVILIGGCINTGVSPKGGKKGPGENFPNGGGVGIFGS